MQSKGGGIRIDNFEVLKKKRRNDKVDIEGRKVVERNECLPPSSITHDFAFLFIF